MEDAEVSDPVAVEEIRAALLDHFDRHARELPWRGERDPYRILVSEVMLQQTRVETVKRYYGPWLERFPTLEHLADAAEDDVLKAWEGLGYYRRARNLHRAAAVVRERYAGHFPATLDGLRALPGVGEYTAGAVASIAFDQPAPAVDGNVRRVLARLFDVARPKPSWLRTRAATLVDLRRPGDFNQALMELGATVCTPRSPACGGCPLSGVCAAREAGTQAERPAPAERRAPPKADFALVVAHCDHRTLLVRRPVDGLLGGMWAFPERRLGDREQPEGAGREEALELLGDLALVATSDPVPLPLCEHRFTHLEARYHPWAVEVADLVADVDGGDDADPGDGVGVCDAGPEAGEWTSRRPRVAWVDPHDPGRALPRAQQRVLSSWLRAFAADGTYG